MLNKNQGCFCCNRMFFAGLQRIIKFVFKETHFFFAEKLSWIKKYLKSKTNSKFRIVLRYKSLFQIYPVDLGKVWNFQKHSIRFSESIYARFKNLKSILFSFRNKVRIFCIPFVNFATIFSIRFSNWNIQHILSIYYRNIF